MNPTPQSSDRALHELESIRSRLEPFESGPDLQPLIERIEETIETLGNLPAQVHRPWLVALIGPTHVGKSMLFNGLLGLDPDTGSPVSDGRAAYTHSIHLGCDDKVSALIKDELDELPLDIHHALPGINMVLVDTPDIDSDIAAHAELAQQVLARADLAILVSSPDKHSDQRLLGEILESWKHRLPWLFVLTKADQLTHAQQGDIRADWQRRLIDRGFPVQSSDIFLISNLEPHSTDFSRLREAVLHDRNPTQRRLRREAVAASLTAQALAEDQIVPLRALREGLAGVRDRLCPELRDAYQQCLNKSAHRKAIVQLVRNSAWQQMAGAVLWPMSMALNIRNRLALIWLSLQMTRLLGTGIGVLGLGRMAMAGLYAAAQQLLPTAALAQAMTRSLLDDIRRIGAECEDALRNRGIQPPSGTMGSSEDDPFSGPPDLSEPSPSPTGSDKDPRDKDWRSRAAASASRAAVSELIRPFLPSYWQRTARQLVEPLSAAIERQAQSRVERSAGPITSLVVNVLPLAVIGHGGYRLVMAWLDESYLPGTFYLHMLVLLVLSFLPGAAWLSLRLSIKPDAEAVVRDVVDGLEHPEILRPLEHRHDELARLLDQIATTRTAAETRKRMFTDKMGSDEGLLARG
ncbi:MAG: 50S ribosome-binding GTPase [Phycisphaeraceae bacterium]|nr:50S ribosome-binding GTPase [Phycisphaeraceae bacterium]